MGKGLLLCDCTRPSSVVLMNNNDNSEYGRVIIVPSFPPCGYLQKPVQTYTNTDTQALPFFSSYRLKW